MLTTFFADIIDFRRPQGRRYELDKILLLSVIAILCNAKSYRDISRFIKTKFEMIGRELLLNWKSPPAYTTIRNIIQGVDKDELEAAFRAFTQSMTRYGHDDREKLIHIAVDGKVLRHSFDHFEDKCAMQKLMFFDTEQSLILGHIAVKDKSNEIPAFQALLSTLKIPGAVFTADALHFQKKLLSRQNKANTVCLSNLKTISKTCWKMCNA
jgi:hypothetical protein